MNRKRSLFVVGVALAAGCFAAADGARPDWENPSVNSLGRLPDRTYSMPLKDVAAALTDDLEPATPWAVSLNGEWKLSWVGHHSLCEKGFWKADFDDAAWSVVDVPSCLETRGFGTPQYTNIDYPHKAETPTIRNVNTGEDDYNPVASYRRRFTVPESWRGRRVILRFDGVYSAYYVWVNGHKVGYAEDSCLPSEFDITPYLNLQPSTSNLLAVQAYRWSDGSFLENQDTFRFHGIFRDVTLWSMPQDGVWDFVVKASADGRLEVEVVDEVEKRGGGGQRTDISLYGADRTKVGNLTPLSTSTYSLRLSSPRLWSAEDPYLYTLVIRRGGDIRMKRIGFKEQKLVDGRFLVNGRPVKVHGVNRCETTPEGGRTVTRADMVRDIEMFKRYNIDTVRTSHYPNHHLWYDLCDRYGIYMVAEANVETHGFNYDPKTDPAFKPEWKDSFVERNLRHVRIYRNHPSVTVWSLGNEAPAGIWATNAVDGIRALDASRPTVSNHEGDKVTDIESGGYGRVESLEDRGKKGGRTFFYIEYAHSMGNALGNFQEYWDVFDRYDCLMGGCVWDWADQSVWKYTDRVDPKTGLRERYLGYGGDWDETPNSGNFCVNGIVDPLRRVSAKLLEVAHVHRPLVVTRAADGTLQLKNRWSFTSADICTGSWELLADGVVTQRGVFEVPHLAPGETCALPLAVTPEPGKECFLNVSFATKTGTRWAEKGWTVARNQLLISKGETKNGEAKNGEAASSPLVKKSTLRISDSPESLTVSAGATKAVFSRQTGTLSFLEMDGRTLLRDPAPGLASGPRLTCVRALTDNDTWMTWGGQCLGASGLMQLRYHPSPFIVSGKTVRVTTAVDGSRSGGFRHEQTWTFADDGTVTLRNVTEPHGTMPKQLPRFGLSLRLAEGLERMRYYGRGPHENYVDRCRSSFFGIWDSTVAEQYVDYLRPQDCGYKTDVRWVEFTDETGKGVRFAASQPLCVQALHYSLEDLDRARHGSREGRYRSRLEPRAETFLNLDVRQCGLGGASCGPKPMDKYLFPAQREEWTLSLSPVRRASRTDEEKTLTVLQSTDLHGSPSVAKYAKWIAAERAADPELLLVDCGDLCNGTFATWIDGGASMVSYLNLCKYDVWVPGNHEFRIGNENFKKDLSLFTAGSVLAANVIVDDPARKPSVPILPWKLFTRKGVRIAVIGMASHRSDDWYDVKPYRGLRLLSPVQALKEVMPAVRAAKPDVIAVAMHSDLGQSAETETGNEDWVDAKDIYAAYPEIVLFLEGHTHRAVPATEFAPGRWIVQPRDNGGSMAKVRIAFDTASRKVTKVTSEFVEAKKLPATDDAHMPEAWRRNNAAAELAAKTPIVRLPDGYVWRAKEKKGGLPPTLVAEAMREAAGSDAAIVCQGGPLRPTTADLTEKFFFGLQKSGFSVLTLTPEQLKKALAASGKIDGRSVGIDPEKLPTKPITVAFDAYDLTGCDGDRMGLRELARSGVPRREVEINLREAVRAYMTKRWPAR